MGELMELSQKAALEFIRQEDRGRRRYLKTYFNKDIDDPLLYHLIVNTDLVGYDQTAHLIGEAVLNRLVPAAVPAASWS